jgi:hypothetical protein
MMSASDLVKIHGLNPSFADSIAKLISNLEVAGLQPRVTSGFRDPIKQKTMQQAWDATDDAGRIKLGLRARPATDSLHNRVDGSKKNALAVDIKSTDEKRAGAIAESLGIGAGINFRTPDPGHYYDLKAQKARQIKIVGGSGLGTIAVAVGAFFLYKMLRKKR